MGRLLVNVASFVPMDGKVQRQALASAERALDALEAGRADAARSAARRAADLDQLGVFAALPRAVEQAADDLISNGSLSELSLSALTTAIGPGPLEAVVARLGR